MKHISKIVSIRLISLFFTLFFSCLLLMSCKKTNDDVSKVSFTATIVSISENTLLVNPDSDTKEYQLCDQIYVPIDTSVVNNEKKPLNPNELISAKHVLITYDGILDNSEPTQITNVYEIQIID